MSTLLPIVVLGAGPAGLAAAWKLALRRRFDVTVLERNPVVGGNAGSFPVDGIDVDFGSHRLHPSCAPEVLADIRSMLADDLLDRPRHGRIRLRGRWVHFPLKPANLAWNLPPTFALGVVADSLVRRNGTHGEPTFASVLEKGLGRTICRDFYFPYAEKIWAVPVAELDAEQAKRRVSAGSLGKMVRKVLSAVPGFKPPGAGRFFYPRKGFGQICAGYHQAGIQAGVQFHSQVRVDRWSPNAQAGAQIEWTESGRLHSMSAALTLSTIPLTALVRLLDPPSPPEVLVAADSLRYRAMLLVYLVLETDQFTEYDAHYFPESDIRITRLSEPKNYGLARAQGRTVLCAELPCSTSDREWNASDDDLRDLVLGDLARAGIPVRAAVRQTAIRRLSHAYPIYTRDYRSHFDRIDRYLAELPGLLTLGRQGLFVHDNTHHTLAMGYAAAACVRDDGSIDDRQWASHRTAFTANVVED